MEVEDEGWDGPNIRPPQLKSSDERRLQGHHRSSSGAPSHHHRRDGDRDHHERSLPRDSRGQHDHHHQREGDRDHQERSSSRDNAARAQHERQHQREGDHERSSSRDISFRGQHDRHHLREGDRDHHERSSSRDNASRAQHERQHQRDADRDHHERSLSRDISSRGHHDHQSDRDRDQNERSLSRDNTSRAQHEQQLQRQEPRSDLRSRISQVEIRHVNIDSRHANVESRHPNIESRHTTSSSNVAKERERDRQNRGHQQQLSESELRLRKFLSVKDKREDGAKRDSTKRDVETSRRQADSTKRDIEPKREISLKRDDSLNVEGSSKQDVDLKRKSYLKRDSENRRQRPEVVELPEGEEKLRRKRERSKSRTDDVPESHKKHQKKEKKIFVPPPPPPPITISDDDEQEDCGSDSSSDDGEVETNSDESSDDETGSEKSNDTPNHDAGEVDEIKQLEAKRSLPTSGISEALIEKRKSAEKEESPNSSINLTSTDDEQQRSPSKSPTPIDEGDTMDVRAARLRPQLQEVRTDSRESFADDIPHEDQRRDEEQEVESEVEDPEDKLPPYLPSVYGCRSVEEFQCLNRIEEGTYGVVYRARDKKTNKIVALKRLKMEREKEGFPITSLREINTLLISQHPNVVTVREIVVGSNMDKIYIVMDFVEHDLKALMETMRSKKQVFLPGEVKCLMQQLLNAIGYLHDNWILHRDLKTSNLLLSHNGILKVGDFGLAREYGSPLKAYTSVVVTLWYRAPELLLGIKEYSTHIDVWSVGCIFGELLLMEPLFTGKTDQEQVAIIFKLLGSPNEKIWPGFTKLPVVQQAALKEYPPSNLRTKFPAQMLSEAGLTLLKKFLNYDPKTRINCEAALKADYFEESPKAIDPSMFPTWPAKSEMSATGSQPKKGASPKPPSGGGAFKNINDGDEEYNKYTGFVLNQGMAPAPPAPWNLKF